MTHTNAEFSLPGSGSAFKQQRACQTSKDEPSHRNWRISSASIGATTTPICRIGNPIELRMCSASPSVAKSRYRRPFFMIFPPLADWRMPSWCCAGTMSDREQFLPEEARRDTPSWLQYYQSHLPRSGDGGRANRRPPQAARTARAASDPLPGAQPAVSRLVDRSLHATSAATRPVGQ